MPFLEVPIASPAFFPMGGYPVLTAALAQPVAFDPQMLAAIPAPIPGSPRVAAARRGHDDHARRRRLHVDFNERVRVRVRVASRRWCDAADNGRTQNRNEQESRYSHCCHLGISNAPGRHPLTGNPGQPIDAALIEAEAAVAAMQDLVAVVVMIEHRHGNYRSGAPK